MKDQPTLEALEQRIAALEKSGNGISEARANELITAAVPGAVNTFATSADGRKLIGAEASRITMEAIANVGTQPVKPAPAGNTDAAEKITALKAQDKFEELWAADPKLQAEFPDAQCYAAYAIAEKRGSVVRGTSLSVSNN